MITFSFLWALLTAFGYNILITVCAMLIGYPAGMLIATLMAHPRGWVRKITHGIKSLFCNVPSFVMLFYLTVILPSKWQIFGVSFQLTPLAKAIIALMIPVIGYASDAIYQRNQHDQPLTLAGVKQFFLLLLMASTTASAIDVKEILATANYYISASGDAGVMLPVYLIVASFFIGFGLLLQLVFWMLRLNPRPDLKPKEKTAATLSEVRTSIAKSQDGQNL